MKPLFQRSEMNPHVSPSSLVLEPHLAPLYNLTAQIDPAPMARSITSWGQSSKYIVSTPSAATETPLAIPISRKALLVSEASFSLLAKLPGASSCGNV